MSNWPESIKDISDAMFPAQRRWWVVPFWKMTRWGFFWPSAGRGGDEWGWHTVYLIIPMFGEVVIRTKPCDCEEVNEFRCPWPACPQLSWGAGDYCITHNRAYVEELIAEVNGTETGNES